MPLTIRTPEGSSVSGRIVTHDELDEAQTADTSQGDPKILAAARRATCASGYTLRKGAVVELPKGFAVVGTGIGVDTQPTIETMAVPGGASGPAPRLGTVALLTPEGERLVNAFASEDWSGTSERDHRAFTTLVDRVLEGDRTSARIRELDKRIAEKAEQPLAAEDFTGKDPAPKDPIAKAIRDCFTASRLTYAAAEVIGHDAVSEILNSAEPPVAADEEAA